MRLHVAELPNIGSWRTDEVQYAECLLGCGPAHALQVALCAQGIATAAQTEGLYGFLSLQQLLLLLPPVCQVLPGPRNHDRAVQPCRMESAGCAPCRLSPGPGSQ